MAKPFKIERLYAWIIEDPFTGEDGVPALHVEIGAIPMIGADKERIEGFRVQVEGLAKAMGKPVRLCEFTRMVVLETIKP